MLLCTLSENKTSILTVAFHPKSNENYLLASGSRDRRIKFWNYSTKRVDAKLEGHLDSVNSIAFSKEGD